MRRVYLAALVAVGIAVPVLVVWFGRDGAAPPAADAPEPARADDPQTEAEGPGDEPGVGPEPVVESVLLPTGVTASAASHFNRNALSGVCVTDAGFLAATDSGHILRFDPKGLRLQDETRSDAAVTTLSAIKGVGVLAGLADGRVVRIDSRTLRQTEFARLPAAPRWLFGIRSAAEQRDGALAVIPRGEEIELHWLGFARPRADAPKWPAFRGPTVAFLDGKSRLWLGTDSGEWGGWCGRIDLSGEKAGPVETPEGHSRGVYGFAERPDGQVWAYGGVTHMGLNAGFISRVDRGKLEELASFERFESAETDAVPKRPRYPITHIIPDPAGDGLFVLSYSDLFKVDAGLTNWRRLGGINVHYRWGRPDAMGSYPAIRTVLATGDPSGTLLGTTARDGLLCIRDGRATTHAVPGQIGDDRIDTILPAAGTSLLCGEDVWRLSGGSWRRTSLFPPKQPDSHDRWYKYRVILDPERNAVALCRSGSTPGAVALTRRKGDALEVLAAESGRAATFSADGGFATPDGSYWCVERETLLRLVDGTWRPAGAVQGTHLWGLRVVSSGPPPWVLHNGEGLFRLAPGTGARDAVLAPLPAPPDLGEVHDALSRGGSQVLLACAAGLRLFDGTSGKISPCPFAAPAGKVRALCRDGRGRTWLAGTGLWMADAEGTVHDLSQLNRSGEEAHAIGADSTDPSGVIVALGRRGVLVVRAEDARR